MAVDFENFYEAILTAPASASDLSFTVSPAPGITEGWLLIDYDIPAKREFIYFTGVSGNTVTVANLASGRGLDGTTAVSHDQNAKVRMNVNAGILKGLRDGTAITSIFPAGAMLDFAGSSAPTGFLLCDGTAVSRALYSTLFAAIGTAYGAGDGSTTFNLPDARKRVMAGYDASDSNFNALGKTGGAATHTLTTGEMPSHNHAINDPSHSHGMAGDPVFTSGGGSQRTYLGGGSGQQLQWSIGGVSANGTGISIQNAGSGGAHNNLQPYLVANKIIKT